MINSRVEAPHLRGAVQRLEAVQRPEAAQGPGADMVKLRRSPLVPRVDTHHLPHQVDTRRHLPRVGTHRPLPAVDMLLRQVVDIALLLHLLRARPEVAPSTWAT